jgi:hypothetical protein
VRFRDTLRFLGRNNAVNCSEFHYQTPRKYNPYYNNGALFKFVSTSREASKTGTRETRRDFRGHRDWSLIARAYCSVHPPPWGPTNNPYCSLSLLFAYTKNHEIACPSAYRMMRAMNLYQRETLNLPPTLPPPV